MISKLINKRISRLSAGFVFCANDFFDLGSRGAIDITLHRLAKTGKIRRLGYGLYDKPIKSNLLGDITPSISSILDAYSRRTGQSLTPDPLTAANALSITTQVPAQLIYLTNGKSHMLHICGQNIKLIHASPKKLAGAGTPAGLIIQALRYYGNKDASDRDLKALAKRLTNKDIRALQALRHTTLMQVVPKIDRVISYAKVH
jgi:hypothetical protein